jgi:hypothetical protein
MLLGLLGPVPGWMCCNAWREGLRRAQHGSPLPQPPCSQSAHRRCAHTRTSQHTSVVNLQVRHTTVDASRLRWTGWRGSNPATSTPSLMASGNAGRRHIRGRSERPHNGWRPPHCASSAAWTIPPHPAHCSARSSGTSAQNRSERTVGSYLESARLADAFLEGRGKRLEQATQADLEDFVAHILRRRSASTNALACRRGSTRANRPATRAGNSSSPTCQQAGDKQGGPGCAKGITRISLCQPDTRSLVRWLAPPGQPQSRPRWPTTGSFVSSLFAAFSAPLPPAAGVG